MAQQEFSIVTKKYLDRYEIILNNMIEQMSNVRLTNSISNNFIAQMIPHHRAAIEMSRNLLQYTTMVPLQEIALNIIEEQTKSIADMEAVRNRCGMLCNTQRELVLYRNRYNPITQTMFRDMKNACSTNDINGNFMREMIPHHRGAVRMSKNALQFTICPELKPILQAIIVSQENGIKKMENLLKEIENCRC